LQYARTIVSLQFRGLTTAIHEISGLETEKGLRRFHSPQTKGLRLIARSPELRFSLGDYIHHSPLRTAGRPAAKAAAALLACCALRSIVVGEFMLPSLDQVLFTYQIRLHLSATIYGQPPQDSSRDLMDV
jgi:hypothetical protein